MTKAFVLVLYFYACISANSHGPMGVVVLVPSLACCCAPMRPRYNFTILTLETESDNICICICICIWLQYLYSIVLSTVSV